MASPSASLINSSALSILITFSQRLIGVVSLLILARLLSPGDFAIAALVSIFIYFFDVLSNFGSEQYIIQKQKLADTDLNTAWSLDILIKTSLFILLIITTPLIANFYDKFELMYALIAASFVLPINSLRNPALFKLKRELNYNGIFWLSLIQKVSSFLTVVLLAFLYENYWAIIIADLVASAVFTIGSYLIIKYVPHFSIAEIKHQWSFSKWMIPKSIVGYLRSQIDTFTVSLLYSQTVLGQYYIARNVALLPSHNLLAPAIEPLLAVLKNYRYFPEKMASHVRLSLYIVGMIVAPLTVFIYQYPSLLIETFLGVKWNQTAPILGNLAILAFYFPFLLILEQYLLAANKLKQAFYFDIVSLVIIAVGLLMARNSQIESFALVRGLLGCFVTFALLIYVNKFIKLKVIVVVILTTLCCLIALGISNLLNIYLPLDDIPTILKFFITGSVYVTCYIGIMSGLIFGLSFISAEFAYIKKVISDTLSKTLINKLKR
ncbi:oligosaccharide flippase family protein [Paraglaciecola sp. 25GB23A]|uniref:oligosaccharide flippase family protein n=1 Tax=Paraglaciecola sp. 25GB23A TaxID=3156068 RepID=UPI0032B001B0